MRSHLSFSAWACSRPSSVPPDSQARYGRGSIVVTVQNVGQDKGHSQETLPPSLLDHEIARMGSLGDHTLDSWTFSSVSPEPDSPSNVFVVLQPFPWVRAYSLVEILGRK